MTYGLTSDRLPALGIQLLLMTGIVATSLYGIRRSRGFEVYIYSHLRLWLAIALASALCVAVYHAVIGMELHSFEVMTVLKAAGSFALILFVLPIAAQMVVAAVNSWGPTPITTDHARPELGGTDFHYSVIRRFAVFMFVWVLLIPGLIMKSSGPAWAEVASVGAIALMIAFSIALY